MEILIYALIFYVIYIIITKLVVNKINNINDGLARITQGDLNVTIDESDTKEFASLSNDINLTVSSLKRLMEEEKERMQKDLTFAKKIQSSSLPSLFPAFPDIPYFDIYATMKTAKEVGGDFYDFYFCHKDILTFLIADVSGKGVPAAMFMMTAKTMIKNFSSARYDITEIVNNVNNELCCGNDAGMFVTSFIGQFNIKTGHIDYVNCGHNPPILIHDNKATYLDSKKDFVLAGLEEFNYQKQSLDLSAGDRLYLYTDGVTEAMNDKKELYSEPRLIDLFNKNLIDKTIYDTLKDIQNDIDVFANGAEQADDITMLEIIYNGGK
ncbi:MAG: SpoIIE family protein phosphatase [Lachnospiraceae bacterium]|nr:SpoIIE family protein phosphatase [Lachnospiraceae bacterium]